MTKSCNSSSLNLIAIFRSWKENEVAGFSVAFQLFLAHGGGSNHAGAILNPAGQSFIFT